MRKVTFSVATCYVGSRVSETLSFEDLGIDEDLQGEELEKALNEAYQGWVWENIHVNYYEVEE